MKKIVIHTDARKAIVSAGYNYAGSTTDETMLSEIQRDYGQAGYLVLFNREQGKITYWTKLKNNHLAETWVYQSSIN